MGTWTSPVLRLLFFFCEGLFSTALSVNVALKLYSRLGHNVIEVCRRIIMEENDKLLRLYFQV